MIDELLFTLPLWLVAGVLIAGCLAAQEVGGFVYRRVLKPKSDAADAGKADIDGYVIGAIFGLMAFMTGLTFSIALDRYDGRRTLIVEEANAISTTYLRASLFEDKDRTVIQGLLRDYIQLRIVPAGRWNPGMDERIGATRALRSKIWSTSRTAVYPVRDTARASYFLSAVNEMLNVGGRRDVAGRAHIPSRVMELLVLYLLVASGLLGLLGGGERRRQFAASSLIVLVALAIIMVLDLDRPQSGGLTISQGALEELASRVGEDEGL